MSVPLAVLHVEDVEDDHLLVLRALRQGGYDVKSTRFETPDEMRSALTAQKWDIILSDHKLPHFDSFGALQVLRESGLDLPFIIVSGSIVGDVAVEAMRVGAQDFIFKNNLTRLVPAIQRELVDAEGRRVRKQAEDALLKSEERFHSLFDNATIGMYRTTPDGRILLSNPAALRMLGFKSMEEVAERNLQEAGFEPDYPRTQFQQLMQNEGTVIGLESEWKRKDGSVLSVRESATAVRDPDGNILYYDGTFEDIGDRKRAEASVRQSERQMQALVTSLDDIVIEFDENGTYRNIWTANENLLVQPKTEMLGGSAFEILGAALTGQVKETSKRVLANSRYEDIEYQLDLADGQHWFLARINPIAASDGNAKTLSMLIRDITGRKQAEVTLRESEERFKTIFEQAPLGVALFDSHTGKIRECNPRFAEIAGRSMEELAHMDWMQITHPDDIRADADNMARLNADKINGYQMEKRYLHPDGTSVWINMTIARLKVADKALPVHLSLIEDITNRKRDEARMQSQLEHLSALSAIDRVIAANFDLRVSLTEILTHVMKELGVDAVDVLVLSSASQMLEFAAERGFRTPAIRKVRIPLGESYAGRAALDRQLIQIPDLSVEPASLILTARVTDEGFVCYYGVPLIAKGQVKGVLEVYHRTPLHPDPEWLDFLNTLAGQSAIAIDNSTLFESFQRSNSELAMAYDATIEGWSHALDLRDKETEGHTQRVTAMTLKLARIIGLSEAELVQVRWGALLHDIGKMGVPDEILHKPGPLTEEEWLVMKKHPNFAHEMLAPIRYLRLALDIPYCHHEKWDGSGYPHGLKGDQIPLTARIFAVVDVWDALSSDRPYRGAWKEEKVREHIRASSGTHFDPHVVDVFLQMAM